MLFKIPILPYQTLRSLDVADLSDMMGEIETPPLVHSEEWHKLYRVLRYMLGVEFQIPIDLLESDTITIHKAVMLWKDKAKR